MPSVRVPWIRIVVGGLLADGFTIVAVFVAATGYSRLVAPGMSPEDLAALARKLGLVIGPTLGTLLTFAFGM